MANQCITNSFAIQDAPGDDCATDCSIRHNAQQKTNLGDLALTVCAHGYRVYIDKGQTFPSTCEVFIAEPVCAKVKNVAQCASP